MPGHTSRLQQTPSDGQWERRLLPRRRLSGPACLADIDRTLPDTDPIGPTTESPPASELARRRSLARLLLPSRLARIAWNRRGTPGQGPRSEEHTLNSSHSQISYAVFCLKKKKLNEKTVLRA